VAPDAYDPAFRAGFLGSVDRSIAVITAVSLG
jgi:hypothetical protein